MRKMYRRLGEIVKDIQSWQFIYSLFLFPQILGVMSASLYRIALLSIVVVLFIHIAHNRTNIEVSNNFTLMISIYLLFVSYSAITVILFPTGPVAFSALIDFLTICLLLMVVPAILTKRKKDIYRMSRVLVCASLFIGILVIFGHTLTNDRPYQITGAVSHIRIGRIIGIGIPISVHYLLYGNGKRRRITSTVISVVLLISIGVSGSRGPLIGAILSTIFILSTPIIVGDRGSRMKNLLASSIVAMLIFFLFISQSFSTFDRVTRILRGDFGTSVEGRIDYYISAIKMWIDSPIFGNGFARFFTEVGIHPHNFLLEILSGLGIVGLVIFLSFFSIPIKSILSTEDNSVKILLLSLLIYAVINASVSINLAGQRMLFFILGLSVSVAVSRSHHVVASTDG